MGDTKGGKTDMDRIGLFKEMSYITIGDNYTTPGQGVFNEPASKGKQMFPGGNKMKSARQEGYFDEQFTRILEGEAYSDPVKLRRQQRIASAKKNLSRAFMPTNGEKTMNGLGTFFGTIGGALPAFNPQTKPGSSKKTVSKNFITNPGKKGTGYGYSNVGLNPYPPYNSDEYDRGREIVKKDASAHKSALKGGVFRLNMHPVDAFDDNPYRNEKGLPPLRKWAGEAPDKAILTPFKPSNPGKLLAGMKAGTFDPYPSHSTDTYGIKYKKPVHVVNNSGRTYYPPQGPKSTPCTSIVNQNVLRSVNVQNYRSIKV